jgi:dipeptidyl aminopeptidase/acylaminoacyl peptidase
MKFSLLTFVMLATALLAACGRGRLQTFPRDTTGTIQPTQEIPAQTTGVLTPKHGQVGPSTPEATPPPAPDIVRFPAFDPAGMIAVSGNGLEVIDPDTDARKRIFAGSDEEIDFEPFGMFPSGFSWSPDGNKLAFQYRQQDREGYLLLADFEKGEIRPIVSDFSIYGMVSWSPDGQKVAFVEKETDWTGRLIVLSLADSRRQQLTDRAWWVWNVLSTWLDDEHLAYQGVSEERAENVISLVRQGLDELVPQAIVSGTSGINVGHFAFSPDRASLLFVKGGGLYYTEDWASGGGEPVFLGLSGMADFIAWSPNGQIALFHAGEGAKQLFPLDGKFTPEVQDLEVMGVAPFPQPWSADSQRLILFDTESEGENLVVYHVKSRQIDRLPFMVLYPFAAAWNPRQSTNK